MYGWMDGCKEALAKETNFIQLLLAEMGIQVYKNMNLDFSLNLRTSSIEHPIPK